MRFERIACVLSLALACSFRAAKAEVATVYRRLLFEQFETVSEAEQFDAEEFYAQLSRQLRVASADPLLGDFSVQVRVSMLQHSHLVLLFLLKLLYSLLWCIYSHMCVGWWWPLMYDCRTTTAYITGTYKTQTATSSKCCIR